MFSVISKRNLEKSIFNWNNFYELQRNDEMPLFWFNLLRTSLENTYLFFLGIFSWTLIAFEDSLLLLM